MERRRISPTGPIAQSAAIVKVLKEWFASSPSDNIISCGVRPHSDTTLSSSYLCMPGQFKDGSFHPLEISLSKAEKVKLIEVDRMNKRDETVSTLSKEEQTSFS